MLPPSSRYASQEELSRSLEELGLCPRALVMASTLSEDSRQNLLQQVNLPALFQSVLNLPSKGHVRIEQAEVRKVSDIAQIKK